MFRRTSAFSLMAILLSGQAPAAPDDWSIVQALAVGEQIQVNLATGKKLTGKLDRVTSDSLFLRVGEKVEEVSRKDVIRLYSKKRGNWAKSTILGTAIGAAAGGGIGAGIMEREEGYAAAVAGTIVLFAAIGAGIGYVLRSHKSVLVYEAPSQIR